MATYSPAYTSEATTAERSDLKAQVMDKAQTAADKAKELATKVQPSAEQAARTAKKAAPFALAAVAVAGLAYLFATKQGKDTRKHIAKSAKKAARNGRKAAGKALDKVEDIQDNYPDLYKILESAIPGGRHVSLVTKVRRMFA
jgi:hypothetical protein